MEPRYSCDLWDDSLACSLSWSRLKESRAFRALALMGWPDFWRYALTLASSRDELCTVWLSYD
jgi:hypothetical protein